MGHVRAQLTTRSAPPGTKDVKPVVHGEWVLDGGRAPRDFTEQLQATLEAARRIAREGIVTEVAVLVYPEVMSKGS